MILCISTAWLAQLIEHLTYKQKVGSSSPVLGKHFFSEPYGIRFRVRFYRKNTVLAIARPIKDKYVWKEQPVPYRYDLGSTIWRNGYHMENTAFALDLARPVKDDICALGEI